MAEVALNHDAAVATGTPKPRLRNPLHALLRQPKVVFAGGFILLLILLALFAPLIAPHAPLDQDLLSGPLPPGGFTGAQPGYWLGTDDLGRDVLSRLIYGTRVALTVAFVAAAAAAVLGTVLGLFAGFYGGAVDAIVS